MSKQINLLSSLPKTARDVDARCKAKTPNVILQARKFGALYFDGPRKFGYGGYHDDGRWDPVARDILAHFDLKPGARVLDVGCAKGFLVKEMLGYGMETFGLDISGYALMHCAPEAVGRLHLGTALQMPFPDASFDCVISINTLHNFVERHAIHALREIQRVSRGHAFVQVDSYHTPAQKQLFEDWALTARFHDYPEGWLKLFKEAGYDGDYDFTFLTE